MGLPMSVSLMKRALKALRDKNNQKILELLKKTYNKLDSDISPSTIEGELEMTPKILKAQLRDLMNASLIEFYFPYEEIKEEIKNKTFVWKEFDGYLSITQFGWDLLSSIDHNFDNIENLVDLFELDKDSHEKSLLKTPYSCLLDPCWTLNEEFESVPEDYKVKLLSFMLKFITKNCLEYEIIQILLKKIASLETLLIRKSKKEGS